MTQALRFFIKGEVRTQSIDEIKGLAIDIFSNKIRNVETNDIEIVENKIFPEKFIHINKKNIEFSESFYLTDFVMTNKLQSDMAAVGCADVSFSVTIFRIGAYSYFTVAGRMLSPDQKQILEDTGLTLTEMC